MSRQGAGQAGQAQQGTHAARARKGPQAPLPAHQLPVQACIRWQCRQASMHQLPASAPRRETSHMTPSDSMQERGCWAASPNAASLCLRAANRAPATTGR
jgi:hypothetical protein